VLPGSVIVSTEDDVAFRSVIEDEDVSSRTQFVPDTDESVFCSAVWIKLAIAVTASE